MSAHEVTMYQDACRGRILDITGGEGRWVEDEAEE